MCAEHQMHLSCGNVIAVPESLSWITTVGNISLGCKMESSCSDAKAASTSSPIKPISITTRARGTETRSTEPPSYKNKLQELTQKYHSPPPDYSTRPKGFPHAPQFKSTVAVGGRTFTSSQTFPRRKAAEQHIAKIAYEYFTRNSRDEEQIGVQQAHENPRLSIGSNLLAPIDAIAAKSQEINTTLDFVPFLFQKGHIRDEIRHEADEVLVDTLLDSAGSGEKWLHFWPRKFVVAA